MKKDALVVALALLSTGAAMGAPGSIIADASPNVLSVGDTLTVTIRISGYTDTIEIDGFAMNVMYPPGLFTFVAGSFNLGDPAGANQQWLSKPNQETAAAGYMLTSFNDGSTPGVAQIEMADLGFSSPERGTIATTGYLVSFRLTAIAPGNGEVFGQPVPGPVGPEVLYDTNLRRAGVPQFLRSNVVVRATCTNPPVITCPSNIVVWACSNSTTVTYAPTATSPCCPNVIVTCVPPSGSPFPAGTVTPVTCTARDTCGNNQSSCTFTVTVRPDTEPPVIRCPTNLIVRWLCTNLTTLDYVVTATDDCDTNVTIDCTPPPGTVVPVPGIYGINCVATDDCGKRDFCQFAIRLIHDTTPPVIHCPTNITVWTCTNTYTLDYAVTATDDCDTNVTIICNPPRGTVVAAPSLVNVSCTARDDCGNISGCQFQVRVIRDVLPPVINCPSNIVVWGCSNQVPVFYSVSATDDCDTDVKIVCTLSSGVEVPPGTALPPGNHVITCVARDDCDHTSTCSFTVRVIRDTTPPVLNCPSNIVAWSCAATAGTTVPYSVTATDDCDPNVTIICQPPPGPFPPGSTTVNCDAIDECGNRSSCSFTVTVRPDTAPPVIKCPTNIVIWVCTNQAVLNYTVTATDDCDTNVTIICDPPPGTVVPAPSLIPVTCTAIDDCQKTDRCEFVIRVIRDTTPPVINCPTNLVVWTCTNTYVLDYPVSATDDCDTNVTIVCTPPEGTIVPAPNIINVTCVARDDCGNTSGCQFQVRIIRDTEPPVLNCPSNIVRWVCTNRIVLDYEVTARDDCDTNVSIVCNPAPGNVIAVPADFVVTCIATDDCGNRDTCQFRVQIIEDTTPPVLTCPTNTIVVWTCNSNTVVQYPVSAKDDCDPNVTIICQPPPTVLLPIGEHTVTCVATDDCGNRDTCTFRVRVIRDTVDPVIHCPTNIVLWACTNRGPLEYTVTATDDCDTNVTIVCTPPPGTVVPVPGIYTVTCVATDDCGNQDRCDFTIRFIRDDLPPIITCPTNLTVWTCTNFWIADYGVTARDDCDTNVVIECIPPIGTPLPIGIHSVACRATDDCGNISGCQFQVRVIRDTTPPVITCPSNIVVSTCRDCYPVEYRVEARDDCDTNVTIVCTPPPGTCFPIGTNEVRCVAIDDCGNRDECKFTVIVRREVPPRLTIRPLAGAPGWVICWPASATGWRLQCTRNLHPPITWEAVTNVPVLVGTQWCVTLPHQPPRRFYRLCKPCDPVITGVHPLNPGPNDIVFIDGSGFGGNPDDLCVAIAATPPIGPVGDAGLGGPDTMILYPLRALFASDNLLTARMPGALPPDVQMGRIMVGHGIGNVGRFRPAFPDIFPVDDVWVWKKDGPAGMGNDPVDPQPEPPPPNECWFFSGEPRDCQLCLFIDPNCPWPSNAIVSITARAHDSVTGAGGYDLDGPTIRFINTGGTVLDCAERIADILRCAFQQQAGVMVEVLVQQDATGAVKITVRIPGGCIDRGFLQVCVRSGNDPVITGVEPTEGREGDIVTIRGANFGHNPDNLCVVVMEAGAAAGDESGIGVGSARYIPLQALEATGGEIRARLGPVPPNARPGRIMVGLGQGAMARFRPAFFDIFPTEDVWTWRKNGQGAGTSPEPYRPIPNPPPPPSNCWFFSEAPMDGKLCVYLTPDCPWPSNAFVTVIARAHDSTTGVGADLAGPNVRFVGGGSLIECADRIADILRCAFLQQSGVVVDVHVELLADGRVKITVSIPGGFLDRGMLTICVGPTPTTPTGGP